MLSTEELKNTKFDVVILGGQSNAYGFGVGSTDQAYEEDPDVFMMKDVYSVDQRQRADKSWYLDYQRPTTFRIDVACESMRGDDKAGNLSLAFAREYRKRNLEKGRKLLIVYSPVGGTGFSNHHWGVGEPLHLRLLDMLYEVLSYNPDNRIVAFLWHQGEHDAFENAQFTPEQRTAFYYYHMKELFDDLNAKFGIYKTPIIAGGFVDDWRLLNLEACNAVYEGYRKLMEYLPNLRFVNTEGLLSNAKHNGTADNIHFCRDALYTLGKMYYDEYSKMI